MKVTIVGKEVVSYTSKNTGRPVEGMSLHYTASKDNVMGVACDTLWIKKGTAIYDRLFDLNVTKPVPADVSYEMVPGGRYPTLSEVLITGA